ncbi:MAG TPA: tRNA (adenosine(37)-N6)-dimethylallyltransferase MiaA [Bacteroidota bacterium]|nr:tRNA (adenosine(37)-N6)-dimethylallyltransferase MiaA [Bacteroidota bacterium]
MKPRTILAIVGPTASGKTSLSILLAEMLGGEIVSADSRQVYKYLDIGTAKPTLEDRARVDHHFIDILEPSQDYSAGQFGIDVPPVIDGIIARGNVPIIVGGSGLYIRAAIDGMFDGPGRDPEIRGRLEDRLASEGVSALMATLREVDPVSAAGMKEVTARRVIRALEVYLVSGKPLSQHHADQAKGPKLPSVQVMLDWDRNMLYERINLRVEAMVEQGLVAEVEGLKKRGYDPKLNALNTVGYKETFEHLSGATDLPRMIELIKQNTRHFAKRQLTWFGADKRIVHLSVNRESEIDKIVAKVSELYRRAANV